MQFKPDPNKQAQEVYFLKNQAIKKKNSLAVTFNNTKVLTWSTQKHL